MERKLLSITQAAERTGVGRTVAYRFVMRGEWPSVKIGRSLRIPVVGLDEWIAERELEAEQRAKALREGIQA